MQINSCPPNPIPARKTETCLTTAGQNRSGKNENRVADIYNAVSVRSEADAINLNRILPILILFYLYINILHLFFINCEVWKFSKIRPMYDKCMTKMITFAADKTS